MTEARPRLLFVSPRFLFPADQGGKIRTTQILKGMKGGRFEIVLASPEGNGDAREYAQELEQICDRFIGWPQADPGPLHHITRLRHLLSPLPVSVVSDDATRGREVVGKALSNGVDLAVFDFLHAMVLAPDDWDCRSLMFTHNVEAEIFARHASVTRNPLKRAVWQQQYRKMQAYEHESLKRFDTVVAVSERDAAAFRALEGVGQVEPIPTGVDLDFFAWRSPGNGDHIVFTGAMDWQANIDGIEFFMDEIWPSVVERRPGAHVTIVGRNPSPALVERARRRDLPFTFTGFVDDIRTHVVDAAAYIIPLRVGGGTRIKAFEAMAMGIPVVSTGLGVEGLPITPDEHYLHGDTAADFADALVRLLEDGDLRQRLSQQARAYVEAHCSSQAVARRFDEICWQTLQGAESD
ncbi:glycosyltransferase family 4 protein [Ectothiorhodospira haloalkaliphila]|uniref:glycosyltransferase n=1 Tax=Ectothiorhodospira haloalkaliphila TaxID=421628 RepID=UPI001EE98383|nr:glycosyltransferase family 4 protein [Ectothiorhodospira haloalkaliphila]